MYEGLSQEAQERIRPFFSQPTPEELRNALAPQLQSAADRASHLSGVVSEKENDLAAARAELSEAEAERDSVQATMNELENVQPAG